MPTTQGIPNLPDHDPGQGYSSSGNNDGSGVTQDWYNHTQTLDVNYARINNYDYAVSSPYGSPVIINNMLRLHFTVQTVDEIILAANFLGDQVTLQKLQLNSNTSAGGFGTQGTVDTSALGLIRRAARKDGNGNILDPSGVCVQTGTMYLDSTPGTYDATYDTSTGIKGILGQLIQRMPKMCETFSPTLVDL